MELDFKDRLLTCSDCHGEFIFTAGEQLFFFDKQFKNDPKRCKPCKSRRSGLAAAASGLTGPAAAGLSRTETRTECSQCGIETTVPFKPTQGRPVLCRSCFQRRGVPAVAARTAAEATAASPATAAQRTAAQATPNQTASNQATPTQMTPAQTVTALHGLAQTETGTLPSQAMVQAAASMATANAGSSVSTPKELAALTAAESRTPLSTGMAGVPTHVLAAAERAEQAPVLEFAQESAAR